MRGLTLGDRPTRLQTFNSKFDDPQGRAGLADRAGLAAGIPNSKLETNERKKKTSP
ncbi:MAG: hypothetical protein QME81_14090 [bacterium]|nr:hypothetical protein [bacterium]